MSTPSIESVDKDLLELLEAKEQEVIYNKVKFLFPDTGPYRRELYPKHIAFMDAGHDYKQRAFIAANRIGKTLTGAVELSFHLTGEYPHWWKGKRFLNPIEAWAAGITNQSTKQIQQKELLGKLTDIGTGTIPRHLLIPEGITKKPGVAGAVESIQVRHKSGGISELTFKSYEQGWESFQGTKLQVIWLDEEPTDAKVYTESLMRLTDHHNPGIMLCTFTPLHGLSDVVLDFLHGGRFTKDGVNPENPYKYAVRVTWDEVPHLSEADKQELLASIPPHMRDARSKGIPSLGSGAIYPYNIDDITVEPFKIPDWWPKAYGLDVGWNRTAAIWIAQDPDSGLTYAYSEHYEGQAQPVIHAQAIKARGDWIIGAIDPAASGVSQADGKALINLYEEAGLILELADNSIDSGILKVGQMFASGQLKIFSSLNNFLSEYMTYRRDENGKIVKKNDHAMDALRYAIMTGLSCLSSTPDPDFDRSNADLGGSGRDEFTGY